MIVLNIDMPKECHECPFQLKFKDGIQDDWYMRRCVIVHKSIEYPKPKWCPLETVGLVKESKDFSDAEVKWTKENLERFLTLTQGRESVGGIPIAEFRHVIGKAIDNLGKKDDP